MHEMNHYTLEKKKSFQSGLVITNKMSSNKLFLLPWPKTEFCWYLGFFSNVALYFEMLFHVILSWYNIFALNNDRNDQLVTSSYIALYWRQQTMADGNVRFESR